MTEYFTIVRDIKELKEGEEIELFVQDLTPGRRKYRGQMVKAEVSSLPGKLPGGDVLWLRSMLGRRYHKPWAIKITERLGVALPGRPYAQ